MARIRSVSFGAKDKDIEEYADPIKVKDFSNLVKELLRDHKNKKAQEQPGGISRAEIMAMIKEVLKEQRPQAPEYPAADLEGDPEVMGALQDIFNLAK